MKLLCIFFFIKDKKENKNTENPSEPRLIANLRRYFADFPYLRSFPNRPEVSNLGDLLRLLVRSIMKIIYALWFSRFDRDARSNHSRKLTK